MVIRETTRGSIHTSTVWKCLMAHSSFQAFNTPRTRSSTGGISHSILSHHSVHLLLTFLSIHHSPSFSSVSVVHSAQDWRASELLDDHVTTPRLYSSLQTRRSQHLMAWARNTGYIIIEHILSFIFFLSSS